MRERRTKSRWATANRWPPGTRWIADLSVMSGSSCQPALEALANRVAGPVRCLVHVRGDAVRGIQRGITRADWGQVMFLVTVLALWPTFIPRCDRGPRQHPGGRDGHSDHCSVRGSALPWIEPVGSLSLQADGDHRVFIGTMLRGGKVDARADYDCRLRRWHFWPAHSGIQPWDDALAYAYPEFKWDPEPVFQDYSAYTPIWTNECDHLAGNEAPDRILWITSSILAIDNRNVWFDAPGPRYRWCADIYRLRQHPNGRCLAESPTVRISRTVATVTTTAGATVLSNQPATGILTVRIDGVGKDLQRAS